MEIIIVISIVGVVIGMAIPTYTKIVGSSSKTKGVNDMTTIMTAIDTYKKEHGYLPRSLVELGLDHLRDPWGRPYVYVPLSETAPIGGPNANADGNDGENGNAGEAGSESTNAAESGNAHGSGGSSGYGSVNSNTISSIISNENANAGSSGSTNASTSYAASSEPRAERGGPSPANGGPMPTINIGRARKDHNLVPINGDYDLYSVGADGKSAPALTAEVSQDDLVRANNGAFVGFARDY